MIGFIYINKGMFLQLNEYTTHTGQHTRINWVEDINQASVFYGPPSYNLRKGILAEEGVSKVEVKVTRIVEII